MMGFIPSTAGLNSKVSVPSVEGMYAENPFLKVRIPSKILQCKSLNLFLELSALSSSLVQFIKGMISVWEVEKADKIFEKTFQDEVVEISDIDEEDGGENVVEEEIEEFVDEVIVNEKKSKMKKKYRKLITDTLKENNMKMKRKKLKRKIIEISALFDGREDAAREEAFEKNVGKVENVNIADKYVILST